MRDYRKTPFFDIALFLYLLWGFLRDTDINLGASGALGFFSKMVIYTSTLCSFIVILMKYPKSIGHILLFFYVIGMTIFYKQVYLYWPVFGLSFLIFAAYGVKVDHIVKNIFYSTLLMSIIVVLLSSLGVLSDRVYAHRLGEGVELDAHSFGFAYYSFFAFRAMLLINSFLFLHRYKCNYFKLLLVIFVTIGVYVLSVTRLQLLTNIAIIGLYIIFYKLKVLNLKINLLKYVGILIYPMAFLFFISLPLSSFISPDFLEWWDENFSGRITQTIIGFAQYPVTLFGNKFEMVGGVQIDDGLMPDDYFYLDSGYAYWLLAYGLLFTIFILYAYSRILYKSYKSGNMFIYMWCLFFAFVNLINDFFTSSYWNPIIFMMFADFSDNIKCRISSIHKNEKIRCSCFPSR